MKRGGLTDSLASRGFCRPPTAQLILLLLASSGDEGLVDETPAQFAKSMTKPS